MSLMSLVSAKDSTLGRVFARWGKRLTDRERRIVSAQLENLCHLGVWLQFGPLILCSLLVLIVHETIPPLSLLGFLAFATMAVLAQSLLCHRYSRETARVERADFWARIFIVVSLIAGFAWGGAGYFVFPQIQPDEQILIGPIILAPAVISVAVGAWYLPVLVAFLVPSLTLIAVSFLHAGPAPNIAAGAIILFLLFGLVGLGWALHRRLREMVCRQIDDREFIERLLTGRASENAVQHRLETALESMSEALAVFDADDKLVICNSRFLGEQRAGEARDLVGISFEEIVSEDVEDAGIVNAMGREKEYVAERIAYHRKCQGTFEIQLADGRWLQVRDRRIAGGGTVIVQTDITAHKLAEEKLRTALSKAEQANRSKSEFLANTSHELRTPLNAIIGFSEIMENQMFGEIGEKRYLEYARDIRVSGEYLVQVVNDLLDLSKIESGRQELADEVVDPVLVIETVVNVMQDRANAKNISIRSDIASRPPCLRADHRMVQQMLLNLVSNAVKFTPAGGKVEVAAGLDQSGELVIKVSDTGIGMNEDDLERAFEPFGRAKGALVRDYEGTGLGLPLSRSLAKLHGGTLELESEPDVGTVAILRFPKSRVLAGTRQSPATSGAGRTLSV